MKYRRLGNSGLKVSEVALGGWLTQGRSIDDATTEIIVHKAYDLGINLFDTADVYNIGEAEKALGKAIVGLSRQSLVIATKCFWPMSEDVNDRGLSRKHIFESVENSLVRMGIDYIDLMQCHRYDETTPVEETVRAMGDLIRQGKILYWGVSVWTAPQIADACQIADSLNIPRPISNQPPYSMLRPEIEDAVLLECEKQGIGQIVFSPLAQGVLTGKYLPGKPLPEGSRGADDKSNTFMADVLTDSTLERVQKLKAFAESKGCTVGQFALAWCLRQSNIASVIVGASKIDQIEENAACTDIELSASDFEDGMKILQGIH